jgi:hypothetical protein
VFRAGRFVVSSILIVPHITGGPVVLRRIAPVFVLLVAVLLPLRASAQQRRLIDARVRVTAPPVRPDKVTGQVTQFDTAGLVVRDEATGAEQTFPLHSIQLLEISHGTTRGGNALQRARMLAFIAGGLGAIAGAAFEPTGKPGTSAAVAGGAGLLLGATIGAAWGSSAPHERWEWAPRPFGYDPNLRVPAALPAPAPAPADSVPAPQP